MPENKVQFNLKNVHYSKITVSGGNITYATPKAIAGAVSLSLDAQNSDTKFYADGMLYYTQSFLSSYEGDLEVARINDDFLKDILGLSVSSTNSLLKEDVTVEPSPFALLFQIDGDQESEYYVFYYCTASKPSVNGATIEDTKEPQTQSMTITASPLSNGVIKARTTYSTTATVKSGWFTSVYTD